MRRLQRNLQRENRSVAWSIAMHAKMPVHLYRSERTTVQAKTMAFLARGETVIKDAGDVLGSDPFALIFYAEAQCALSTILTPSVIWR